MERSILPSPSKSPSASKSYWPKLLLSPVEVTLHRSSGSSPKELEAWSVIVPWSDPLTPTTSICPSPSMSGTSTALPKDPPYVKTWAASLIT